MHGKPGGVTTDPAELSGLKHCNKCREELPVVQFGVRSDTYDGLQPWCKPCTNARNRVYHATSYERDPQAHRDRQKRWNADWRAKDPERVRRSDRDHNLRYTHGISLAEWEAMFDAQGRVCGLCAHDEPRGMKGWHVDHDHATGKIRSILCAHCNVGLGAFGDDPERLRLAAAYLEAHR